MQNKESYLEVRNIGCFRHIFFLYLDGVSADAAEGVYDDVTTTPLCYVLGDGLGCNREPRLVVKLDTFVEPAEQVVPARKIKQQYEKIAFFLQIADIFCQTAHTHTFAPST